MARYRFHCTNGLDCVFDAQGREIRVPARLLVHARRVATDVRHRLATRTDWSEWRVSVHDLAGRRVLSRPFDELVEEVAQASGRDAA